MSAILSSSVSIFCCALSISNLEIRLILISVKRTISSSTTGLFKCAICGFSPLAIAEMTPSHVSSSSISR